MDAGRVDIAAFGREAPGPEAGLLVVERALAALSFVHGLNVTHGAISTRNILVDRGTLSCRLVGISIGAEFGEQGPMLVAPKGRSPEDREARQKDLDDMANVVEASFSRFPWAEQISKTLRSGEYTDRIEFLPSHIQCLREKLNMTQKPSRGESGSCGNMLECIIKDLSDVMSAEPMLLDHGAYRSLAFIVQQKNPNYSKPLDSWLGLIDKCLYPMTEEGGILLIHTSGIVLSGTISANDGHFDISKLDVTVVPVISPGTLIEIRLFDDANGMKANVFFNLHEVCSLQVDLDLENIFCYPSYQSHRKQNSQTIQTVKDWAIVGIRNIDTLEDLKKSSKIQSDMLCRIMGLQSGYQDLYGSVYGKILGVRTDPSKYCPVGIWSTFLRESMVIVGPIRKTIQLGPYITGDAGKITLEVIFANDPSNGTVFKMHTYSKNLITIDIPGGRIKLLDKSETKKRIPTLTRDLKICAKVNISTENAELKIGSKSFDVPLNGFDPEDILFTVEIPEKTMLRQLLSIGPSIRSIQALAAVRLATQIPHPMSEGVRVEDCEDKVLYMVPRGKMVVFSPPVDMGKKSPCSTFPGFLQLKAVSGSFAFGIVEGMPRHDMSYGTLEQLGGRFVLVHRDGSVLLGEGEGRRRGRALAQVKPAAVVAVSDGTLTVDGSPAEGAPGPGTPDTPPWTHPGFLVALFEGEGEAALLCGGRVV